MIVPPPAASAAELAAQLRTLDAAAADYALRFVDLTLAAARNVGASDVHLQPTPEGLELAWRIDGVLQPVGALPAGKAADVVSRLKVLAELLTYRTDVPQEGRIRERSSVGDVRVSTFPTLFGERAVVRFFARENALRELADLGLPDDIRAPLARLLHETSGAILICGPAGSGKTTTAYACLREISRTSQGGRSLVTLEDPVEIPVPGVSQSPVQPAAGFTMASGLRSLLRQDPEVILVGEIRDRETAEVTLQAALTGQLVLSTFHAGSAAEAYARLLDMGSEPYLVRSGVLAVLGQRLLRRLCTCAVPTTDEEARLGLPVTRCSLPRGCTECHGTGYRGRLIIAELMLTGAGELPAAILARADAVILGAYAMAAGMIGRWPRACTAVETGLTSPAEVRRVLGFEEARGVRGK